MVGPEAPLAAGITDTLTAAGIDCFGPTRAAAQIESSKEYAKGFMDRHGIPTARWKAFSDAESACHHIMRYTKFDSSVGLFGIHETSPCFLVEDK